MNKTTTVWVAWYYVRWDGGRTPLITPRPYEPLVDLKLVAETIATQEGLYGGYIEEVAYHIPGGRW